MAIIGEWFRRLGYLLRRRAMEEELEREMEAHRAEMNDPRAFGNTLRLREAGQLLQRFLYGVRSVEPVVLIAAPLTLLAHHCWRRTSRRCAPPGLIPRWRYERSHCSGASERSGGPEGPPSTAMT